MGQEMFATWRRKPSDEPRRIHRGRLLLARGLIKRRGAGLDLDVGDYVVFAFLFLAAAGAVYVAFFM
jgi:hypothetical protein